MCRPAALTPSTAFLSKHVNIRGRCAACLTVRDNNSSSSSRGSASRDSLSAVRMGVSPLPDAESLRKTVVSTAAALLIAFSPAIAPCQQAFAAEGAGAQEMSPAEMLVQKTTDMQVRGVVRVGFGEDKNARAA